MKIENQFIKQYKKDNNLTYSCQYHIAFCPKYGRKILDEQISKRADEVFKEIAKKYNFDILESNLYSNYVHMVVDCSPELGILECVTKLKRISSGILKKEFPQISKKVPTLWTRRSLISTVGEIDVNTILKYVEEQKNV